MRLAFETQNSGRINFRTICARIYHERDGPIPTRSPTQTIAQSPQLAHHPTLFGISNFYRGFTATIVGMIPYAGVSFWAHDTVGDVIRSKSFAPYTLADVEPRNERELRHPKLKNQWEAVAGGLAGLLAQTSSYPVEVVRRRMQVGGAVGNHEMKGAWQTVKSIYLTGGIRGFYIGLSIGYIKAIPPAPAGFLIRTLTLIIGDSNGVLLLRCVGANETMVRLELEIDRHCFFCGELHRVRVVIRG